MLILLSTMDSTTTYLLTKNQSIKEIFMKSIEDTLRSIPRSYDDFVQYVMSCIKDDSYVEKIVLEQISENPASNSSDVLKAVTNYLGINTPLEVVPAEVLDAV